MIQLPTLVDYCDQLLAVTNFKDACPNGLQVEANPHVSRLVTGVTASQALIDAAIAWQADTLLVHHGYFWKNEPAQLTGLKGRRIAALFQHRINLLAYHLPLDCHPQLGNNAQLALRLNIQQAEPVTGYDGLLWRGRLPQPISLASFASEVQQQLDRKPSVVEAGTKVIETIAWCSGAAQGMIEQAAQLGVDAYLSGEISEQTTHQARELGLHYLAAGHHATECDGVKALGQHLAAQFNLEQQFIAIPNPA